MSDKFRNEPTIEELRRENQTLRNDVQLFYTLMQMCNDRILEVDEHLTKAQLHNVLGDIQGVLAIGICHNDYEIKG